MNLVKPWCHSILSILSINHGLMYALAQSLFMHPVVVHAQLDVLHVDLLCELYQLLELILAKNAQKGS